MNAQAPCADSSAENPVFSAPGHSQLAILDLFFPGFSVISAAFQRHLGVDLNVYVPLIILCGGATFAWQYFSDYLWGIVESHLMSSVEIRTDDEIYVS